MPIAIVVAVLLVIVVLSYRQTIYAYPSGGGAYVVSKENLGETAVARRRGVAAHRLHPHRRRVGRRRRAGDAVGVRLRQLAARPAVPRCDHRDDHGRQPARAARVGALFAPPTYLYIVMLGVLIVVGLYRVFVQDLGPIPLDDLSEEAPRSWPGTATLSLFMLLRAFSSGAVALSGVEAVSNGVPTFRKPESRNASTTLAMMGRSSGSGFLGISVLASHLQPYRGEDDPTGIALMAEYVFGGKNVLFWVTQLATFAILVLAANTAYAGFPGLSSIIARDGYLPRQLANRGDKLVFSNGIIFLAVAAGVLIIVFEGNISALIPLYAFGVFTGFTLSQAGMVVHHFRLREPRWKSSGDQRPSARRHRRRRPRGRRVQVHQGGVDPGRADPRDGRDVQGDPRPLPLGAAAVRVEPGYKPLRHTHTVVILVGTVTAACSRRSSTPASWPPTG